MPTSAVPPNQTLYINNLNDKIRKPDLRISLYMLFSTYGVVLDVVALKTMKHRGQAHIAFRDVASATQAMRALQGMNFFGKDMVCGYIVWIRVKQYLVCECKDPGGAPTPKGSARRNGRIGGTHCCIYF